MVGTIVFTFFQMRRKKYLTLSWSITVLGLILSGLSINVEMFIFSWGLTGFGAYASYIIATALLKETSSKIINEVFI